MKSENKKNKKAKSSDLISSNVETEPIEDTSVSLRSINVPASQIPAQAELSVETLTETQRKGYILALNMRERIDAVIDTYRLFTLYAKQNFCPKETTTILKLAGFRDDEASRLKAVTCLPDQDFEAYQKGTLNFHAALDRARDEKSKKAGRTRKRNLSEFRHVQKAASKLVVKNAAYERIESVSRSSAVVVLKVNEDREAKFELDTCVVFVRVQLKK